MVKEKNYKHKELAVLRQDDIIRMKVTLNSFRKLSVNPPKRKKSSRKSWQRKKRSKSWLLQRPKESICWGWKSKRKRTCPWVSHRNKKWSSRRPSKTRLTNSQTNNSMTSSSWTKWWLMPRPPPSEKGSSRRSREIGRPLKFRRRKKIS